MSDAIAAAPEQNIPTSAHLDPELKALIKEAVREAVKEEMEASGIRSDIEVVKQRLDAVEGSQAQADGRYASKSDLDRMSNSFENRSKQFTTQIADLTNVTGEMQEKYKQIAAGMGDLAAAKQQVELLTSTFNNMNNSLNTFMENQRERVKNHDERLTRQETTTTELRRDLKFTDDRVTDAEQRFIEDYVPLRDFIKGSDTQKPLKVTIDGIETAVSEQKQQLQKQGAQLQTITAYVESQVKKAEEEEKARREYWRNVRKQFSTPRGVMVALTVIVAVIIFVQAIDLQQAFDRIRDFFTIFGIQFTGG